MNKYFVCDKKSGTCKAVQDDLRCAERYMNDDRMIIGPLTVDEYKLIERALWNDVNAPLAPHRFVTSNERNWCKLCGLYLTHPIHIRIA